MDFSTNFSNRPRRLRQNANMRRLVCENRISADDLIAPLFVVEGPQSKIAIDSMPGHYRLGIDQLLKECETLIELGVPCVSLFPALDDSLKDTKGTESANADGLFPKAIRAVKERFPELLVMTDVALDPYSSDGHDGLVDPETGAILNDDSLPILAKMALVQAQAGSDIIGPSDMMDGRVGFIRDNLDANGYSNTVIMSYSAKYASAYYGPFRDALDSAPKSGDKKTYQMDYANSDEAIKEVALDLEEGADIVMVKPGLPYLDVVRRIKDTFNVPVAAYNVSGEYAMVKAAAQNGWMDENHVMVETLTSFKRAGADMILTYFAKDLAQLLK